MPTLRNREVRGDHYVTLVVEVPDRLSHEAKELLRQFDAESGDSLNAAKKLEKDDKASEAKDGKEKKKKFWK